MSWERIYRGDGEDVPQLCHADPLAGHRTLRKKGASPEFSNRPQARRASRSGGLFERLRKVARPVIRRQLKSRMDGGAYRDWGEQLPLRNNQPSSLRLLRDCTGGAEMIPGLIGMMMVTIALIWAIGFVYSAGLKGPGYN